MKRYTVMFSGIYAQLFPTGDNSKTKNSRKKREKAAAKVFGDMSAIVAQSPLAAALALGEKMKSGKAITFDDF